MKIKLPAPRNPLVVAARFLKAGGHRKTLKALRRSEKIKLMRINKTGDDSLRFLLSKQPVKIDPATCFSVKDDWIRLFAAAPSAALANREMS